MRVAMTVASHSSFGKASSRISRPIRGKIAFDSVWLVAYTVYIRYQGVQVVAVRCCSMVQAEVQLQAWGAYDVRYYQSTKYKIRPTDSRLTSWIILQGCAFSRSPCQAQTSSQSSRVLTSTPACARCPLTLHHPSRRAYYHVPEGGEAVANIWRRCNIQDRRTTDKQSPKRWAHLPSQWQKAIPSCKQDCKSWNVSWRREI